MPAPRTLHLRLLLACLLLSAILGGCTSPLRKLSNAQQLQKDGKYEAAIKEYSAVLARVGVHQREVISLIELYIGECQLALGDAQAAVLSLQNSLANHPENLKTRLRLGELMLAGGAPQGAIEQALWMLDRNPLNPDALTLLGSAYVALGQSAQAQHVFERALALDPNQVAASLKLAHLHATAGNVPAARRALQQALSAHQSDPGPWLALARLEEESGNAAAAEQAYRKAINARDDRQTRLRLSQFLARASRISEAELILAQVDQNVPETSASRGDFKLVLGRAVEAVREYASVLQRSDSPASPPQVTTPHDKPASGRSLVIARLIEAQLALAHKQDRREKGLQHANALLEQHRKELDEATVETLRAEISLVSGDLPQAEQHSNRAIELAPRSPAALFVAGQVKHAARDLPAANRYWDAALELDAGFLPARQAVAARALESGDGNGAEQYILPVVREEPANFEALCIYARAMAMNGQLEAATVIARRALAADGTSPEPHIILGNIAATQNRLASAFIEYQQAILLDQNSSEAVDGLAKIYKKGSITRATLRRMERVAASPPASVSLMEVVGRLYAERGWNADAERALEQATKLDPSRATAASALALTYARDGKERAAADSLALTGESTAELVAGLRATEEENLAAAVESYESAVRRGEPSGVAANNLAWIYAERGMELDRALELAQLARRLEPRDPAVLDTVGFVQLKRREYSEAVTTLKQAIELAQSPAAKPMSARTLREVKRHLAEAYLRSGQPEAAAALKNSVH